MEYIITQEVHYKSVRDGSACSYTSYLEAYSIGGKLALVQSSMSVKGAKKFPTWRSAMAIKKKLHKGWSVQRYTPELAAATTN